MSEINHNIVRQDIAEAALNGIRDALAVGELQREPDDALLVEGLLLAMQMAAGPELTARVIRYSFVMASAK